MRRVATMISDRRFRIAFASTLLFATLMLVPASPAYASIADDVNAWLAGLLRDACNWMFTNQVAVLSSIGYEGIIGADFSQMLTTAGDVSMYDIARGVWDAAVLPIGCGVLGLVFTVKLIQISQRMDGNASFPGVKEVVFLLVFFAVFLFLIQNSFELMEAIYSVVGLAIDRTMALFGAGGAMDLSAVSVVTEDDDVPALIALLLVSVISWVVVLGAYIVALVVCWARAIQLYVMAAFGPIPLSLMALDDTRQIGIGYLKNFTAVCLAGLIILILLVAFPLILGGLTGASTSTGTPIDGIATGLTYALQYLAMCVLLILSEGSLKGGDRLGRLRGFRRYGQAGGLPHRQPPARMQRKGHGMPEKKNTYLTLHKNFVREGIPYTDRETGEQRTFNSATMPRGTSIDGRDVSFFEFSPLYVNESRKGEDYRDIPLLKGREVWLQKTVLGEDGKPVLDADGGKVRETVKVMPEQVRFALDQQRQDYLASLKQRSLHDRADAATRSALGRAQDDQPRRQGLAHDDIPF